MGSTETGIPETRIRSLTLLPISKRSVVRSQSKLRIADCGMRNKFLMGPSIRNPHSEFRNQNYPRNFHPIRKMQTSPMASMANPMIVEKRSIHTLGYSSR